MIASAPIHATAVARWTGGAWRAALLRGPSGAGKSDLALRAMSAGWRLVADDRVLVWASGKRAWARAPMRLAGLLETRGLGVLPAATLPFAQVVLVVDLVPDAQAVERVPEPAWAALAGISLSRIALFGLAASAPSSLALALQAATLGAGAEPAYQARLAEEAETPGVARGPLKRNR